MRSAEAKADEDDTEDPVQETFKKLYAPNSGKRIKYGVFQETMSASEKNAYTDEEKALFRAKLEEWAAGKLAKFDADEGFREARVEKYADRAGYETFLNESVEKKMAAVQ